MTALTVAMTEAYFRAPPTKDWLPIFDDEGNDQLVLACHIADAPKKRTGEKEFFDPRTINAEVAIAQSEAAWRETNILPTDGVGKRLRGDRDQWRLKQQDLNRQEQKVRVRKFHPSMVNDKPSDFITADDRARFIEQARNIMAQLCNLTMLMPRTQILAPKWATRLCEMVEREMHSLEEWGKKLTAQIEGEYRAMGGTGVEEINHSRIDRLAQQRQGARFQYYHCQLLLHAFKLQHEETRSEYGALMSNLPGAEHNGESWQYVSLRDRVKRRQQMDRSLDAAAQAELERMKGMSEQDYRRWQHDRTSYKPRHGQGHLDGATPEVAQPMSDDEISFD